MLKIRITSNYGALNCEQNTWLVRILLIVTRVLLPGLRELGKSPKKVPLGRGKTQISNFPAPPFSRPPTLPQGS